MDYAATIEAIMSSGADVVFNTIVPPGLIPFLEGLHQSGFAARGGKLVCTYFDENVLGMLPSEWVNGVYSCLDSYVEVDDPFSRELYAKYNALYPNGPAFGAGSGCTGMYKGLKVWQAAVLEAGSLDQASVVAALDHAELAQGPGGSAQMVPGQHHLRTNMYIAQANNGRFRVVKPLGPIDPKEQVLTAR